MASAKKKKQRLVETLGISTYFSIKYEKTTLVAVSISIYHRTND